MSCPYLRNLGPIPGSFHGKESAVSIFGVAFAADYRPERREFIRDPLHLPCFEPGLFLAILCPVNWT